MHRSLKLWHLVVYGIIIIQPTAPMGIYGVVSNVAGGHVVTTILIGMVAMLFTAVSYGRMARVYPSAGSAYTYVGKEVHPMLGYVVGWSMLMDYLLNPIICAIWCSAAARNVFPNVPYAAWAVAFVVVFTVLNLRGVKTSSRVNALLALGMSIVVVIFLAYAIRYIAIVARPVAGQWLLPFYDPATFSPTLLFRGTSIAVLTYTSLRCVVAYGATSFEPVARRTPEASPSQAGRASSFRAITSPRPIWRLSPSAVPWARIRPALMKPISSHSSSASRM